LGKRDLPDIYAQAQGHIIHDISQKSNIDVLNCGMCKGNIKMQFKFLNGYHDNESHRDISLWSGIYYDTSLTTGLYMKYIPVDFFDLRC